MEIRFDFWNTHRKKFMGEKSAIRRWDLWNNENKLKEYEKGIIKSSKDLAKTNHNSNKAYEFSILENNGELYGYATINPKNKHVGVHFIDPGGRKYLTYLFTEINEKRKLFLREVWYYHFTTEEAIKEEYRINFGFNEDGDVSLVKYDDRNQKLTEYEGKEPIDVKLLYEEYPEFGKYEGIIKEDREIPFLKKEIIKPH